ncbi:hypothetical protein ACVITL_006791 [Rhizobium pisi]
MLLYALQHAWQMQEPTVQLTRSTNLVGREDRQVI